MTTSGAEDLPGRLVLDTSTYSRARRGTSSALDALARAEVLFVPTIVLGELEAGFRVGARYRANRRALDEFLHEPFVHVLDVDADTARFYGEVFAALREAGTPIPVNDIWIAATTRACGGHLLTYDADFAKVDALPHTLLANES